MGLLSKIWRKLFPVRETTRIVQVFNTVEGVASPLKKMDEMLPMFTDLGRTNPELMSYHVHRLISIMDELHGIESPKKSEDIAVYALQVRETLARAYEVRQFIQLPQKAIRSIEKKERSR